MRYINHTQEKRMLTRHEHKVLQTYFPENDWFGADVDFLGLLIYRVTIYDLSNVTINSTTWTHCANIQWLEKEMKWEVNTQFNGEKEDEMWVYRTFTRFADACRYVARKQYLKDKPIAIY